MSDRQRKQARLIQQHHYLPSLAINAKGLVTKVATIGIPNHPPYHALSASLRNVERMYHALHPAGSRPERIGYEVQFKEPPKSPEAHRSRMDDPLFGSWTLGRSLFALTMEDHSSFALSNLILCMCFDV